MALATLSVDLVANLAKFEQGMKQSADIAKDQAARIDAAMKGLKTGIEALGIAAFVASQINAAKAAIDTLDKLDDLSEKFGIAAKDLSAYRYASEVAGTTTEAFAAGLNKLSKNMAAAAGGSKEQAAAFAAVGVSVKDANGHLRSADDVLLDLAEKFSGYKDSAGKAALAQDIFGKSGADLIPLLNKGRDGIKELRTEAEKLGAVYGNDLAKAAGDFNDNLTKLKLSAEGAKVSLVGSLLPALVKITDEFINAKKAYGGFFSALIDNLAVGAGGPDALKATNDELEKAKGNLERLQKLSKEAKSFPLLGGDMVDMAQPLGSDADIQATRDQIAKLEQRKKFIELQIESARTRALPADDRPSPKGDAPIPDKTGGAAKEKVDQELKLYDELKARIQKKVDVQQIELDTGEKVTAQQQLAIDVMADMEKSQHKLTAAHAADVKTRLNSFVVRQDEIDQQADATKRLQAENIALAGITEKRLTDNKALSDAVQEIGLSRDQLEALTQQRLKDKLAIEDQAIATAKLTGANQASLDLMAINADALRQEIALRQQSADKLRQLREDPAAGSKQALDDYVQRAKDVGTSTKDLVSNQLNGLEDQLANFFVTGKADWKSFFQSIAIEATKINIVRPLLAQLSQVESAAGSGGGFLSLIAKFAGLFGGGSTSGGFSGAGIGSDAISAKGNAFNQFGRITAFAKGDIFDSPTLFKFAKGTGVMGEAGPEAIMPLRRGADGKLGIAAKSGGDMKVTVVNNTRAEFGNVTQRWVSQDQVVLIVDEAVSKSRTAVAADMNDPNSRVSKSYGRNFKAERNRT